MSGARWRIDRLVDDVAVLARRGLAREQFYSEVTARLRRVFDCDAACWHTLDPQTHLITSDAPHELVSSGVYTPETDGDAGAKLIASEYFVPDVNTFAALASRRVPVGILSTATRNRPERSTRYRELLAPSGIPFELRGAFVSRGRVGEPSISRAARKPVTSRRRTPTRSPGSVPPSPTASAPRCASTPHARPATAPVPDSSSSAPRTRSR